MLIGGHVSSAGGLSKAVERAEQIGAETMQIFNQSPRMWRPTRYSSADCEAFRARLGESPVESIFIHAVYLINVASDDAEIRAKSLTSLTHALTVGDSIGAGGVMVHPGSGKGRDHEPTCRMIAEAFRNAIDETESTPLLLENTAGAGGTVGRRFADLALIIELAGGHERFGVCLDSCHLHASGYEIRNEADRKATIDECERDLGMDRVMALHLNDSMTPLGSNRDRHANLGDGELGEQGIVCFLSDERFGDLPVLLEVPGPEKKGPDRNQIEIGKRLRDQALKASAAKGLPAQSRGKPTRKSKAR
jgi:deoxyribonuclease-4